MLCVPEAWQRGGEEAGLIMVLFFSSIGNSVWFWSKNTYGEQTTKGRPSKHREPLTGIATHQTAPTSFMAWRHDPLGDWEGQAWVGEGSPFPPQIHRLCPIGADLPIKQHELGALTCKGSEHWTLPPPGKSKRKMKKSKQAPYCEFCTQCWGHL